MSRATIIRDTNGFALPEVLVGLTVAGLAIASIGSLFSLWSKARERADHRAAFVRSAGDTGATFRGAVEQLVIPSSGTGGGISGNASDLSFVSWPPTGTLAERFVMQRWRHDPTTHRLLWSFDKEREIVLQSNIVVQFAYFGRRGANAAPAASPDWHPSWPPPSHISMRVKSVSTAETLEFVSVIRAELPFICALQADHPACDTKRRN